MNEQSWSITTAVSEWWDGFWGTLSSVEVIFYISLLIAVGFAIQQFRAGRLGRLNVSGKWHTFMEYSDFVLQAMAIGLSILIYQILQGIRDIPLVESMQSEDLVSQIWLSFLLGLIFSIILYAIGTRFPKR